MGLDARGCEVVRWGGSGRHCILSDMNRLFDYRFRLGRLIGIDLYLHWSLALMVAYVAAVSYSTGASIVFGLTQMAGLFLCVTMHEYGHCLVARRLGIPTADITLTAIGGVARLRFTQNPMHEFLIAIAGPAVNVVIIAGLLIAMPWVAPDAWAALATLLKATVWGIPDAASLESMKAAVDALTQALATPSFATAAMMLLLINTALVVFNLLPAFPMDGGRVFRSVLAMIVRYPVATRAAAVAGWPAAMLMAYAAVQTRPPSIVMLGVALFVVWAGHREAQMTIAAHRYRGVRAGDVAVTGVRGVPMDATGDAITPFFQTQPYGRLPVVDPGGIVVGTLTINRFLSMADQPDLTAGMMVDRDEDAPPWIEIDEPVAEVLPLLSGGEALFVTRGSHLVGAITGAGLTSRRRLNARSQPTDVNPLDPISTIDPPSPIDPSRLSKYAHPSDPVTPSEPAMPSDPATPGDLAMPGDPAMPSDPPNRIDDLA